MTAAVFLHDGTVESELVAERRRQHVGAGAEMEPVGRSFGQQITEHLQPVAADLRVRVAEDSPVALLPRPVRLDKLWMGCGKTALVRIRGPAGTVEQIPGKTLVQEGEIEITSGPRGAGRFDKIAHLLDSGSRQSLPEPGPAPGHLPVVLALHAVLLDEPVVHPPIEPADPETLPPIRDGRGQLLPAVQTGLSPPVLQMIRPMHSKNDFLPHMN